MHFDSTGKADGRPCTLTMSADDEPVLDVAESTVEWYIK